MSHACPLVDRFVRRRFLSSSAFLRFFRFFLFVLLRFPLLLFVFFRLLFIPFVMTLFPLFAFVLLVVFSVLVVYPSGDDFYVLDGEERGREGAGKGYLPRSLGTTSSTFPSVQFPARICGVLGFPSASPRFCDMFSDMFRFLGRQLRCALVLTRGGAQHNDIFSTLC